VLPISIDASRGPRLISAAALSLLRGPGGGSAGDRFCLPDDRSSYRMTPRMR
jgi:hypothetical protein